MVPAKLRDGSTIQVVDPKVAKGVTAPVKRDVLGAPRRGDTPAVDAAALVEVREDICCLSKESEDALAKINLNNVSYRPTRDVLLKEGIVDAAHAATLMDPADEPAFTPVLQALVDRCVVAFEFDKLDQVARSVCVCYNPKGECHKGHTDVLLDSLIAAANLPAGSHQTGRYMMGVHPGTRYPCLFDTSGNVISIAVPGGGAYAWTTLVAAGLVRIVDGKATIAHGTLPSLEGGFSVMVQAAPASSPEVARRQVEAAKARLAVVDAAGTIFMPPAQFHATRRALPVFIVDGEFSANVMWHGLEAAFAGRLGAAVRAPARPACASLRARADAPALRVRRPCSRAAAASAA
jgi:hypothetical protein